VQVVPSHAAPLLFAESHVRPQPEQFVVVFVCVSQPTRLGGVAVQSPHPKLHVYEHVAPLQLAVPCCDALHALPQAAQLDVVFVCVSHPSVFGGVVSQSPQPDAQAYEHVPAVHPALPWAVVHTRPHAPQLAVVVFVSVSHPSVFGAALRQSPHPLAHEYEHVVPSHVADPCAVLHTFPQAPQLDVVLVCVSQPPVLGAVVTQSPQPTLHTYEHVVPLHDGVPRVVSHTFPQPPQLVVRLSDVSHPLVFGAALLQSSHPGLHVYEHVVPLHEGVPRAVSHALPQPPQLVVVVVGVSQPTRFGAGVVVQSAHPELQVYEHVVPLHVAVPCPDGLHALPQPPQLVVVLVGVSQPPVLGAVVTQSAQPAEHAYEHVVPLHEGVPRVVSHALPQPPQLAVVVVGVSQPTKFGASVTQSAQPPPHVYEHVVPLQVAVPCPDGLHALPQPPQLVMVFVCVSQPFVFTPDVSQSAQPPAHPM
jgi:hypothetical protein